MPPPTWLWTPSRAVPGAGAGRGGREAGDAHSESFSGGFSPPVQAGSRADHLAVPPLLAVGQLRRECGELPPRLCQAQPRWDSGAEWGLFPPPPSAGLPAEEGTWPDDKPGFQIRWGRIKHPLQPLLPTVSLHLHQVQPSWGPEVGGVPPSTPSSAGKPAVGALLPAPELEADLG